eukprot:gene11227-2040_t
MCRTSSADGGTGEDESEIPDTPEPPHPSGAVGQWDVWLRGAGSSSSADAFYPATAFVFSVEIPNSTTSQSGLSLLVITKRLELSPPPKDLEARRVQAEQHKLLSDSILILRSRFAQDVCDIKAQVEITHFSMISYLQRFPGLVHFTLVDRNTNRCLCPSIRPLPSLMDDTSSFVEYNPHEDVPVSLRPLMAAVNQMVQRCLSSIDAGYQESIFDMEGLQCHHKIWVEDDEGTRDAPPSIVKLCAHTPWALSAKASRELARMQVWELYSMHISVLSPQAIIDDDLELVKELRSR